MSLLIASWSVSNSQLALLAILLGIALAFEFVNGFHDTANAVATVIYTKSLSPRKAVVWSGICNFIGVHIGGTAVAFSIVHLLPVDLLVSISSSTGVAMVLALLISATAWNLGTWYLGLPASSSHTLIGAVIGVGLANAMIQSRGLGAGVNWTKVTEIGASLLISPIIGFSTAALLLLTLRKVARNPELYEPPVDGQAPPTWVRAILLGTCTGVSLAHGSNDGQKGVGLIMLILIGLLPAQFALDPDYDARRADRVVQAADALDRLTADRSLGDELPSLLDETREIAPRLAEAHHLDQRERWMLRSNVLRIDADLGRVGDRLDANDPARPAMKACRTALRSATDFAPTWVTAAVACALGLGTMVGWKRIVVTVGEKIGKSHLTYAQGASAELVAMSTIGLADLSGLPVSTTHVLSSGVAGTMAAERHGLQFRTVRAILLAWVFTLPASMLLSGGLFTAFNAVASSASTTTQAQAAPAPVVATNR